MSAIYQLLKPILFKMDPEQVHELTLFGFRNLHRLGMIGLIREKPPLSAVFIKAEQS